MRFECTYPFTNCDKLIFYNNKYKLIEDKNKIDMVYKNSQDTIWNF